MVCRIVCISFDSMVALYKFCTLGMGIILFFEIVVCSMIGIYIFVWFLASRYV